MNDFSKILKNSWRRWLQNYYSNESSHNRWLSLCMCARAFVCILNSFPVRAVKRSKHRNGRKDDQRLWVAPTWWGLLAGQDDLPFHGLSSHQLHWTQSSSSRLQWKQSWPFTALWAVGYRLKKGCDPCLGITHPDFYCFLLFWCNSITGVHTVLYGICGYTFF